MACYTFKLGNQTYTIKNSITDENQAGSKEAFLVALQLTKHSDPVIYQELCEALLDWKSASSAKALTPIQDKEIAHTISDNLERYGIKMHVKESRREWEEFCASHNISPNAKSFVLDGEIYTSKDNFHVADAMHELTHIILAYMQVKYPELYDELLTTVTQHPEVKKILDALDKVDGYNKNNVRAFKEEALIRFIESWYNGAAPSGRVVTPNGESIDVVQYLNTALQQGIVEVFGIDGKNYNGVIDLFNSLLADIPKYGSTLFTGRPITQTGYSQYKEQIKKRHGVDRLIDYYLSKEALKMECV